METERFKIFLTIVGFLILTQLKAQVVDNIELSTKNYNCICDSIGVDSLTINFTVKSKSDVSKLLIRFGYIDNDTTIIETSAFNVKKIKGQYFIEEWQAIKIIYHLIRWNRIRISLDICSLKLREVNFCIITIYDNNFNENVYFYRNSKELIESKN